MSNNIIDSAREIVAAHAEYVSLDDVDDLFEKWKNMLPICRELLRLHDAQPWTSTPPTEPGWYWLETNDASPVFFKDGHIWFNTAFGDKHYIPVAEVAPARWLGPITPADAAVVAELRRHVEELTEALAAYKEAGGLLDQIKRDLSRAAILFARQLSQAHHQPSPAHNTTIGGYATG